MFRLLFILSSCTSLAGLVQQLKVPPLAEGRWDVTAMVGPRDSVVARYDMVATRTRVGWRVNLPNRAPLPARVLIAGGDSVIFEIGPFASILRAGETVTTRTIAHFRGDTMTGTIVARFSSGDSLVEKATANKRSRKAG